MRKKQEPIFTVRRGKQIEITQVVLWRERNKKRRKKALEEAEAKEAAARRVYRPIFE